MLKLLILSIRTISYSKNVSSPPTINQVAFSINLCKHLEVDNNVPKEDQCSDKAFGCRIVTNFKGDEKPRITSVTEIAKLSDKQTEPNLEAEISNGNVESKAGLESLTIFFTNILSLYRACLDYG